MERRKFLIGAGSTAIGASALVGSGAFTSVSANRKLVVETADDADALLALEAEGTPNANEYVDETGNAISIDISTAAGDGVNDDAKTIVRNLFQASNEGSQAVYVWAEGLPTGVSMFHDDDGGTNYKMTGTGNNQGAFSDTSNLDPSDPADVNDPKNPAGYEAAPKLTVGETLHNIGLSVDTTNGEVNFDDDIVIKAVAAAEVE
ncbi:hypothetical protein [Natrinema sp. HArc-T2]|uniref:hypothetical protein n=1 Tax=Natrinema sp. HArc-T2 TaxID=3242701 RepID=UPI00359CDBE5